VNRFASVAAAALLAGCSAGPAAPPPTAPSVAIAPQAPATLSGPVTVPPATAPITPSDPSLARLAGLRPNEVTPLLGPPGFVRRDRGVEIWQYRNPTCVLHLFLYTETAGGLKVAHAEAREPGGRLIADAAVNRACLGAVSAQRAVG
jgi:hypothetical protein